MTEKAYSGKKVEEVRDQLMRMDPDFADNAEVTGRVEDIDECVAHIPSDVTIFYPTKSHLRRTEGFTMITIGLQEENPEGDIYRVHLCWAGLEFEKEYGQALIDKGYRPTGPTVKNLSLERAVYIAKTVEDHVEAHYTLNELTSLTPQIERFRIKHRLEKIERRLAEIIQYDF